MKYTNILPYRALIVRHFPFRFPFILCFLFANIFLGSSCKSKKQAIYGAFQMPNAHVKPPLAMFHTDTYVSDTNEIIDKISNPGNPAYNDFHFRYFDLFNEIFDGSGNLILPSYTVGTGVSPVSKWCKNASFIYTINRKGDGSTSLTATQKSNLPTNKNNELNNNAHHKFFILLLPNFLV